MNQVPGTFNQPPPTTTLAPTVDTFNKNISIVVPYIHGLGEKFQRACNNKGIQVHFKSPNTIKTLLMAPMDRDKKLQKSGVIYKFKCPHINCPEEYIEESGRTLGDRVKEHLRDLSPIHQHSNTTEYLVSPDCLTIVHRESQRTARNIKEAMYIQVNDPSLNRNMGKYQLPHILDHILQDIPALQLKQNQFSSPPSHHLLALPHSFPTHQLQWGTHASSW